MALMTSLKENFGGRAAAAGMAAALAITPLGSGAVAQDNRQQAEFTQVADISAPTEAARWSLTNVGGVGVAVSMGTEAPATPAQIETAITGLFQAEGITNVRFFFDRSSTPGTAFSFHVDGGSTEVLTIATVRAAVPVVAADARHMVAYPELARN